MSTFTPAPTPATTTTPPATPTPARAKDPSTAAPTSHPAGAAPEQYRSAAGCLMLLLATVAALGALALFVALFGDVGP